jgi:hypothetical protein
MAFVPQVAAVNVAASALDRAVLCCGNSIAMSIVANEFAGARREATVLGRAGRALEERSGLVLGGRVVGLSGHATSWLVASHPEFAIRDLAPQCRQDGGDRRRTICWAVSHGKEGEHQTVSRHSRSRVLWRHEPPAFLAIK